MKLITPVEIPSPSLPFTYGSSFFTMGSCFATNLAKKLQYAGFTSLQNPVGILFHPLAIQQFTEWINGAVIDENCFIEVDGKWKSLQAHSQLYAASPSQLHAMLQDQVRLTRNFLARTTAIFITYGTAFSYQHVSLQKYVANCHKQPKSLFYKELIAIDAVVQAMQKTIQILQTYSQATIYISVSPVRHSKDGFVENNLSKAHLLSAVHQVVAHSKKVQYFPAYEVVMDELRDYRFYDRDLLHPNALAIDYIWEKFCSSFFDEATLQTMKSVDKYRKLCHHKPLINDEELIKAHHEKTENLKRELLIKEARLQLNT